MYGPFYSCTLPALPTCVSFPVNHIEQCINVQRAYQPNTRQINITVPVIRNVRTLVPITRTIHGTKNVTYNVTVTRQVAEQVNTN
jgi:hypothetical protein